MDLISGFRYSSDLGKLVGAPILHANGDYPEDVLFKMVSAKLQDKDAAVHAFFEKFTITTEDQLTFLTQVDIDGMSPADAAAEWVKNNEAVWSAWFS